MSKGSHNMSDNMYKFTVSGSKYFPVELLAEQKCFPATKEDADSMANYGGSYRIIDFVSLTRPNVNLWRYHGWSIRHNSGFTEYPEDYSTYHTWPC